MAPPRVVAVIFVLFLLESSRAHRAGEVEVSECSTAMGTFSTTLRSHKTYTYHVAYRCNSPVLDGSTDMKSNKIDTNFKS